MMKPLSEVTGAGWKCQHDYFSYQALVLALTEFAVPKVSAAGMAGTRFLLLGKVATKLAAKEGFIGKVFKKIKPKAGWREEFKLEKNIIHVIYFQARPHALLPPTFHHPHVVISHASAPRPAIHFQALLWFMQPFFPFGAVLGPILLFLDYKWEVLELVFTTCFAAEALLKIGALGAVYFRSMKHSFDGIVSALSVLAAIVVGLHFFLPPLLEVRLLQVTHDVVVKPVEGAGQIAGNGHIQRSL